MDRLTSVQRHKVMAAIKGKNTRIELMLRHALWHCGIRYRKNWSALPGTPDIAITKYKIAVFCDSGFWHGRELERVRGNGGVNREYWIHKLERNVERDIEVNDALLHEGWLVLRFWESDIEQDLEGCVKSVLAYLPFGILHGNCK